MILTGTIDNIFYVGYHLTEKSLCKGGNKCRNKPIERGGTVDLLQWMGGICYFLNKVFLSFTERARYRGKAESERRWRIASWTVYLSGLPAWIIIFVSRRNWIAASVEASGAPAMLLGLMLALRGIETKPPGWLDRTALVCMPLGFAYSLYDIGPMTTFTQWLEVGLALGFLVGTYRLAKQKTDGYRWFALMNLSCGTLMGIQGYPWLALQQALSLLFVADAYRAGRRNKTLTYR